MIKRYTVIFCGIILFAIVYEVFAYSSGGIPTYSNAPNESNCTSCHFGTSLNGGGYLTNLIFSPNFAGGGYVPDSTYVMTVAFKETGRSRFGFEITCLDEATNTKTGTFSTVDSRTQLTSASVAGKTRQYVEHTSTGNVKTSTDSIYWKFKWKAPASNVGNVKFYVTVNATNSDGTDAGDHIYAKAYSYGLSTLLPKADAQCLDSISCAGTTVRFIGVGTQNPTSYNWSFPSGTPSTSTAQNPTVTYGSAGTKLAILTVKNAYGASAPDTFKCIVNALPQLTYLGKTSYNLCPGDSVRLIATTATFGATFKWSPVNKTTSSIYVKDTGTYYVTVKSPNGCEKSSVFITVRHKKKPTVTLSVSPTADTLCKGALVTLNGSSATPDSFFYYSNGSLLNKSKSNSYIATLNSNANYTLIVRDTNGCYSNPSNNKIVTAKNPLATPVVSCQTGTTTSLVFLWSSIASSQGYEVSIDSGKSWITPSSGNLGNSHTITGMQPDTKVKVRLRAKDLAPCYYSAEGSNVCQSLPCSNINFNVTNDTLVCRGTPASVKINGLYDDKYALSFNGGVYGQDTLFSITPVNTKTYQIQLRDSNNLGCPLINRFATVEVDTLPGDTWLTTNQKVCQGSPATIHASKARIYTYVYNGTVLHTGTDTSYSFIPVTGGNIKVYRQFKACSDTINYGSITVKRIPVAAFTYTNNHYDYTLRSKDTLATTYTWLFSDTTTLNGDTVSRNLIKFRNKSVKVVLEVSDFGGCSNRDSVIINVPDYSSLVKQSKDQYISIYPNPVSEYLTVKLGTALDRFTVKIMSIDGRLLKTAEGSGTELSVNTKDLPSGTYMIVIQTDNYSVKKTILVE